jgi:hypothetical protein
MAHYLNYPFTRPLLPVAHDVAPLCKSVEGFVKAYKEEGMWGSVEIGGMIGWHLIRQELPDLKTVVVRRPLQDVYGSIANLGLQGNLTNLAELNATLDLIASQPDVYSINASDLDAPAMGKWLFEFCLELEFDFDWWYELVQLNIQIKIDEVLEAKEEIIARYNLFREDVLSRMDEVRDSLCLQ